MRNSLKILFFIHIAVLLFLMLTAGASAVSFSPDAVMTGDCGEGSTVYWEIVPNGEKVGDSDAYSMNIFGNGVFQNLDWEGKNIGYGSPEKAKWNEYRLKITKVFIGDGITGLGYSSFMHHKYLHTAELGNSLTKLDSTSFEGCDRLETIYRKGNTPEKGTFDLRGITFFGSYVFDGAKNVKKIILPTEGQYKLQCEFLKENNALEEIYIPKACTLVEALAFSRCHKLKRVYFEGDTDVRDDFSTKLNHKVYAFEQCTDGLTISAHTGTNAHKYALEHASYTLFEGTEKEKVQGMKYEAPHKVSIYDGEEKITEFDVVHGFKIGCIFEDKKTYVIFEDEERTRLISDMPIMSDISVSGAVLFDFVGYSVRTEGYNGLRAIYNYDSAALAFLQKYSITEMGVLGAKNYGIDTVLDIDYGHGEKKVILKNGDFVGKLTTIPRDSVFTFACSAVGYEDESGKTLCSRVASEIITRAYVIIRNNETGEETVLYSLQNKKDITSACVAIKEAEGNVFTNDEIAFIDELISLGVDPDYIYTKEEALEHLTRMYNDTEHILSGQHLKYSETTVLDTLKSTYINSGELPAVVSYDAAEGYRGYKDKNPVIKEKIQESLADQFAEYAKQGGLISFCAHMTNPSYESGYSGDPYRGSLTIEQWDQLLVEDGNLINKRFKEELSGMADLLRLLEDRGVTVFWRPYHEMNGAWFWFCGGAVPKKNGKDVQAEYFVNAWIYMYDYLVKERGLDNLYWVYSPNIAPDGNVNPTCDVMKFYPGDDYVDVMAVDWYNSSDTANGQTPTINTNKYNTIWERLAGKYKYSSEFPTTKKQMPVVYGEYGPAAALRDPDPKLSYNGEDALDPVTKVNASGKNMGWIVFWASWNGNPISLYTMDKSDVFMKSEFVYDLSESRDALLEAHYSK